MMSLDMTLMLLFCAHYMSDSSPDAFHPDSTPYSALRFTHNPRQSLWLDNGSLDEYLTSLGPPVNRHQFRFIKEPKTGCSNNSQLVVYVHSSAANFGRRSLIRRTWGNRSAYDDRFVWTLVFVVALPKVDDVEEKLTAEAERHDDILQLDFVDDYHNMTYKAIGALRWLASRCTETRYFLKTDDDTFVNTYALFRHIRGLTASGVRISGLLACCRGHLKVVYRTGKWAVSKSRYPDDYYPHYCSGMAYLLTHDVLRAFLQASLYVPYFWIDDVYVTGMLPELLHLRHVDMTAAYVLDTSKIDELFTGSEWYKFAFCHIPDQRHFENLWQALRTKAASEMIPIEETVVGRLAENYTYKYKPEMSEYYVPPLL